MEIDLLIHAANVSPYMGVILVPEFLEVIVAVICYPKNSSKMTQRAKGKYVTMWSSQLSAGFSPCLTDFVLLSPQVPKTKTWTR